MIYIVGSLNMDLSIESPYIPAEGETVTGGGFMINPGGKGANQAIACAKLGGKVKMLGAAGQDDFGKTLIESLSSAGVDVSYIKKTKPINPFTPLMSKLLFNLLFSIPSIVISVAIFASFSHLGVLMAILLSVAILLIQYGHIFYSATLDIMNPQNEQYATIGEEISNPNENKSTIMAFVISFAVSSASLETI